MSNRIEQVDFFIEDRADLGALIQAVCRVVDRWWQEAPTAGALVRVDDASTLARLDGELWTFRDDAFIPHAAYDGKGEPTAPVMLTTLAPEQLPAAAIPAAFLDATGQTPAESCAERFSKVAVVLDAEPARREAGRERFREWRRLGLTPNSQRIGP